MGIRVLKRRDADNRAGSGPIGYQSQGFSVSGVMDIRSFKIANLLLDNPENEAVPGVHADGSEPGVYL